MFPALHSQLLFMIIYQNLIDINFYYSYYRHFILYLSTKGQEGRW